MLVETTGTPNLEAVWRLLNWVADTCIEIERREAEQAEAVEVYELELVEE